MRRGAWPILAVVIAAALASAQVTNPATRPVRLQRSNGTSSSGWDGGFAPVCTNANVGLLGWYVGDKVLSDGGRYAIDAGFYECAKRGAWLPTGPSSSGPSSGTGSTISILAVADGGTGQANLGLVKVGSAFTADAASSAQGFDHAPVQCSVGSLAAGIDSVGAAQCYAVSTYLDAGGEYCAGPGGSNTGTCSAATYTGRFFTGDGSPAAPGYTFTSAQSTGLALDAGALDFVVGGTSRLTVGTAGNVRVASDGTTTAPAYGFASDPTAGLSMIGGTLELSSRSPNVLMAYIGSPGAGLQVGNGYVEQQCHGGFAYLADCYITESVAGAPVRVSETNGLQVAGVAHASLPTPTTSLAGTQHTDTTHGRLVWTDGGAWYHIAHVEDLSLSQYNAAQWYSQRPGAGSGALYPWWYNSTGASRYVHGAACTLSTKGSGVQWGTVSVFKATGGGATTELARCALMMCNGDGGVTDDLLNQGYCSFDGGAGIELGPGVRAFLADDWSACDVEPDSIGCNTN